jgi:ornithine cyclodeaminase
MVNERKIPSDMIQLSNDRIEALLDYPNLVAVLRRAFAANYTTPLRHHHNFDNPAAEKHSTLLLMPSWDNEQYLGVKMVTISPENTRRSLPTIQGTYFLFDLRSGVPLLRCDARLLTVKRTAAASALASTYLSRPESERLLMIGTGYLAPHLIEAHAAVRPIKRVDIWGRNFQKAKQLADNHSLKNIEIKATSNLEDAVSKADIISAATLAKTPILKGEWLQAGQHLDLVGSYLPDHREADDDVIRQSIIYVDVMEGATKETGDIVMPLQSGLINRDDIRGDLFSLCRSSSETLRADASEITLFKSVGHALEDLATASFLYERLEKI